MKNEWLDSLVKLYEKKLHLGTDMMRGSKRQKMEGYLEVLEEARQKVMGTHDESLEKLLKEFYYDLYVIKEEDIPYSVYEAEIRAARERGLGTYEVTEQLKRDKNNEIINDQKTSLDKWIEYFLWDEEAKSYSGWEVYWVLEGLQKLGPIDVDTKKFTKRDKNTVYPFPYPDKQAIVSAIGLMQRYLSSKTGPDEIKAALGQANFKTLYEYSLEQLSIGKKYDGTDGIWIKYPQGDDYLSLMAPLQGYVTGWCIASCENFARDYLKIGDFYIFYSKDENGEYKVPRIAIRMDGHNRIGEIRGIEKAQNLEAEMIPILDEKLKEFPDREAYEKRVHDMALLTEIDNKVNKGVELTLDELRFLYEIDSEIQGFGWSRDPRIDEIREKRDMRADIATIYDCKKEEVALDMYDLNEGTVLYYGNLYWKKEEVHLPNLRVITGTADFSKVTGECDLRSLERIGMHAYFSALKDSKGLESLQTIGEDAFFTELVSAEGLSSLEEIGGYARFLYLRSSKGLEKLRTIGEEATFIRLKDATGLKSLQSIGCDAYFNELVDSTGLESLQSIAGNANFESLVVASGLESLQTIGGGVKFESLIDTAGLESLQFIGEEALFDSLTDATGLKALRSIGGYAYFPNLNTPRGLESLQSVGRTANFEGLTDARGLESLQSIGEDALFYELTDATGLSSLQSIGGNACFPSLIKSRGLDSLQYIGLSAQFEFLTDATGLRSLQSIGESVCFASLTDATGLESLQSVGRYVNFDSLTDGTGLENLKTVNRRFFDINEYISKHKSKAV